MQKTGSVCARPTNRMTSGTAATVLTHTAMFRACLNAVLICPNPKEELLMNPSIKHRVDHALFHGETFTLGETEIRFDLVPVQIGDNNGFPFYAQEAGVVTGEGQALRYVTLSNADYQTCHDQLELRELHHQEGGGN